jgi:hypothetical protein
LTALLESHIELIGIITNTFRGWKSLTIHFPEQFSQFYYSKQTNTAYGIWHCTVNQPQQLLKNMNFNKTTFAVQMINELQKIRRLLWRQLWQNVTWTKQFAIIYSNFPEVTSVHLIMPILFGKHCGQKVLWKFYESKRTYAKTIGNISPVAKKYNRLLKFVTCLTNRQNLFKNTES